MQAVKKVEIIVDTFHIDDVLSILEQVHVSGYTVIKNTSGKGNFGIAYSSLDFEFTNSYIMTVCTDEIQLNRLVELITPLLKKFGGIRLVTESQWVVH